MPKSQPTSAKRARRAARAGAKYTEQLRAEQAAAEPEAETTVDPELVIAALTELVRRGGILPVRVIEPENPEPRPGFAENRIWGFAEAAVDGYVIRECAEWHVPHVPASGNRWPRVPVPHLTADGGIAVAEMPPLVWSGPQSCWRWVYAHSGWAVEAPGQIADCASSLAPSMELPYEVMEFRAGAATPGAVLGEDYRGGPAYWGTSGWCANRDAALELADALVDFEGGALRVQVWEHNQTVLNDLPTLRYQRDAAPDRPRLPRLPWGTQASGRPDAPGPDLTAEPAWNHEVISGQPPNYALHVWNGQTWRTHSWHQGRMRANAAADRLRIGVEDGRYTFGYVSGPHFPRAWAHDWTQDGRSCADLYPETTFSERSDREHMQRVLGGALTRARQ